MTSPQIASPPAVGTEPYIRAAVEDCRGGIITLRNDISGRLRLNTSGPHHSYLADIVRPGDPLNLINPKIQGEVVEAEFIIYCPDYLINVTEVAACFEDYGVSPLTGIVRRFSQSDNSSAINLGNFASQLLDAEINTPPGLESDFRRASVEFFRNNAINLATCALDSDFRQQALRQAANIRSAVRSALPACVPGFRPGNVILEPAFFSEMLGLQGRMDLLQSDYSLVMEQKSGKGAFAPGSPSDMPHHSVKHYVQLLLYMAIIRMNYRSVYEANSRKINAFLMYSRYGSPVLRLGMSDDLLRKALEVRNMTAAYMLHMADGDLDFLLGLTPESLAPTAHGRFFERYIRPQLAAVLDPLHNADPLSLSYFRRMLRFIAMEQTVAKTGAGGSGGFADSWRLTTDKKLESGNIYPGLRLIEPTAGHTGHVRDIVLGFDFDEANDMANFRTGDSVILYPYEPGSTPDLRRTMVFRCAVAAIEPGRISLSLRFEQSSALPFSEKEDYLWAIEHDYMDSAFNGLYKGVHNFLTAPDDRRDLLLLRRRPRIDRSRRLAHDYGDFNTLALRAKQAQDLYLIIGPPGTGKTSFGLTTTLREQLADPDSSVLLVSYTNRAVDEICSKLIEQGIDFMRVGSEMACDRSLRPYLIGEKVSHCRNVAQVRQAIAATRVFTGTVSALNGAINLLSIKSFGLMIVDEASQIPEPLLLPLLCRKAADGTPSIAKTVMIGDHKQLPAVVLQSRKESAVTEPELNEIELSDCRLSLFERLLRRYGDDPDVTYMLTRQGRMHRDIADFPNRAFYGGRLDIAGLPHQTGTLAQSLDLNNSDLKPLLHALTRHRIAFIDVQEPPATGKSDKVNRTEAAVIADLAEAVVALTPDFRDDTLGIIVPYRNQIAAIRELLPGRGLPADSITVDTVERFQGSQREYIIYGFTAKRPGQLAFLTDNTFTDTDGSLIDRKLNVAMTRARAHLVLVGNAALLSAAPVFASLISYCRTRRALYADADFIYPYK